jgi:recombination protein RecT
MAENHVQVADRKQQIKAFEGVVNNAYYQNQLKKLFGEKNAGTFATSMMELYTSNADLQQCDPKLVAAEAFRAAALHLPLSRALSRAYVVVFKDHGVPKPQFLIGYLGLLDLADRSGQYEIINADVVYKGELLSKDKLTGLIDLSGQKESNEVVGYFAYFKLISGRKQIIYMDVKQMCHYAKMYAPTLKFSKLTEEDLYKMAQEQAEHGPKAGAIGWFGDFNNMAKKTVLRQLLKRGPMSIEIQQAIDNDEEYISAEERRDEENLVARPVVNAYQAFDNAEEVKEEAQEPEPEDKPDF